VTGSLRLRGFFALLLSALMLALNAAHAHEARPAYLEIKETAQGRYNVVWRTPVLAGMRLPVLLKLPAGLDDFKEPVVQERTDSLVERRWIDAGLNGLAGRRIEFPGLQLTITDVLFRFELLDGAQATELIRPSRPWVEIAAPRGALATMGVFLVHGVEHILLGIDHLLFVLALLIIVRGTWRLVKTVTAFTIAHSITLALATLGYVHVPSAPVEALIALSIVFVAVEIVHLRQGQESLTASAPWLVAFSFGLLHGLGFAGALSEVGLPAGHIPLALLFFNLGVEVGQLLFIAAVLCVMALIRQARFAWPRWADLAAPYAIGSLAMFWVIERVAAF
jgi:hydrogenase/urease accessory protein HupE